MVARLRERSRPRAAPLTLLLLAAAMLQACMFRDLQRNLKEQQRFGTLRGNVSLTDHEDRSEGQPQIVVFAYSGEGANARVANGFVLPRPGAYFLIVPVGAFRVAAFEDRNGDRTFDAGEPVGLLRDGTMIEARPGESIRGLDLVVGGTRPDFLGFPVSLSEDAVVGVDDFPQPQLGEVTSIGDARFSEAAAQQGLWRPVEFLFDVGAGIYFLEPYDPDRIPVLFVHGAVGHPANWSYLIERLDRRRFQPWLAYYPTAARLDVTAAAIGRWLQSLDVRYDYRRPVIVAHSMGGLVARGLINQQLGAGSSDPPEPGLFVTISTPWQGHEAAALGIERAPVAAPSWYDLAPGSALLDELLRDPLPRGITYYLFFTYGGSSRLYTAPNDGVVSLASQLDRRAQNQAVKLLGFDAGHALVLRSPAVADELNAILATDTPE